MLVLYFVQSISLSNNPTIGEIEVIVRYLLDIFDVEQLSLHASVIVELTVLYACPDAHSKYLPEYSFLRLELFESAVVEFCIHE